MVVTPVGVGLRYEKYWFREDDLIEPLEWGFIESLPKQVRVALLSYMRGEVSIGKAAEMSGLGFRRFDEARARARVPVRAPTVSEEYKE